MPAYDGTARVGLTLDKLGFGLLTLNGVPIPAVSVAFDIIPGDTPMVSIRVRADELRAALEAANITIIVEDEAPVEPPVEPVAKTTKRN